MSITSLRHPSHHRTWIEIDLDAVEENVRTYCTLVGPGCEVMPAVKANAYGHGAVEVSQAALAGGATRLAVATACEGEELRRAGITVPIQVLGASLPEEVPLALECDLILSIHNIELAQLISLEAVRMSKEAEVHLKIDTGMGRLGILPEDAAAAATEIASLPCMEITGVFMHFADAVDEVYSRHQFARFTEACALLEKTGVNISLRHAASSAAAILYPEAHCSMIRPGAGIYGFLHPRWLHKNISLCPVFSWKSVVVQLKDYPEGSSLGYNRTFTTRRPTRVAILPVGYADGYIREFSNCADVLINGRRAPVIGLVSMDYSMVDVTEVPDVNVGSEAVLVGTSGEERISLEELAEHGRFTPYRIPSCIGIRPGRCYIRGGKSWDEKDS